MVGLEGILQAVRSYYGAKLAVHGPTPRGVDWNSPESQRLRFLQLLRVVPATVPFSLNDYGCGYAALLDHVREQQLPVDYRGFDISPEMVACARARHPDVAFTTDESSLTPADYTVASGVFNVRGAITDAEWQKYVFHTLAAIAGLSRRGFAFNMLTRHADPERMRADLHYADPGVVLDYVIRSHSRYVALLHDYGLYEFTVLVRY